MKFMEGKPTVTIFPEILNKIKKFSKLCEHSIYWMGKVICDGNNYYIADAVVVGQTLGKNAEINLESLQEFEMLSLEEGYESCCMGRTKRTKSVIMTDKDLEYIEDLFGKSGYMIYIQTNKKDELSLNLIDFEKGIIFDDIPLTVCDTEYYTDEQVMEEIKFAIEGSETKSNNYVLTPDNNVKPVEIRETDENDYWNKQLEIVGKVKDKKAEEQVVFEPEPEPPYEPNEFVKENIDFRSLVRKVGGENDA